MTEDGFGGIGRLLDRASLRHGSGRVLLVLEGGTGRGPLVGGATAMLRELVTTSP